MSLKANPWEGMETPLPSAFSTRKVDSNSAHNFMWIKDGLGRVGLALSFDEEVEGRFAIPAFMSLEIGMQSDKKTITLILKEQNVIRQFRIFCEDCVVSVQQNTGGSISSILLALETVVKKWVELFDGNKQKQLSKSSELGLIGELLVMRNILMKIIDASDSVLAWSGPKGHEQDFSYNSSLIEVKCQLISKDKVFTISSFEQLDQVSGQIYLSHVGISPVAPNSKDCFSLPSLVDEIIESLLSDKYAIDTLLGCLALAGYTHDGDRNFDSYVESFMNIYKVEDGFPKITKSDVHPAIEKCTYKINATMLGHWHISKNQLLKEIVS